MLKRLLVLVAALAALLVFAPTASAQGAPGLPQQCQGTATGGALTQECLTALLALPAAGLPEECENLVTGVLVPDLSLGQSLDILACVLALAPPRPPVTPEAVEPFPGGYGYDYGYDVGYDLGYDGFGYDGDVPEGGVDSGSGPTGSDAAGAPVVARGAALLALLGVLTTGLLIMRRRAGS